MPSSPDFKSGGRSVPLTKLFLASALASQAAIAGRLETEALIDMTLVELLAIPINVGDRGNGHSLLDSVVPTDVITADQIRRTGYAELGKVLQTLLPYFNFPRAAIADGTDHQRPFTLRGMGADQVLVLINGKRRHAGALLHLNATIGRGTSGPDINMIPAIAVERIEVLRDGAAAQYGSDAIAGIVNIVLRNDTDSQVRLTSGRTADSDGEVAALSLATGTELGDSGYIRIGAELRERGTTNASGLDTRQQYFDGDPRNDEPPRVTHRIGDAGLDDLLLNISAELPVNEAVTAYATGLTGERKGDSTGFFRRPLDNRTVRGIYPDGFLPHIRSDIDDIDVTIGLRHGHRDIGDQYRDGDGWNWDLSYTHGYNRFRFDVANSLNASLGLDSPTAFNAGALIAGQQLVNLDLFKSLDLGLEQPLELGVGLEWRHEYFEIRPGEPDSWRHGGVPVLDGPNAGATTAAGSQVFPGFKPENATDVDRSNLSGYIDTSYALSDQLELQAALRFEHYSDFGDTLNGKLAAAFTPTKEWLLRGSLSSGFRAPSLAQSHFTSTATVFVGENPYEIGTFPVDHPLARDLGARDLKPETSEHAAFGVSFRPTDDLVLSLDGFLIDIQDRIILSGDITRDVDIYGEFTVAALEKYGVEGVRFFTNAVDTRTHGLDLSIRHRQTLFDGSLTLGATYHTSRTRIVGEVSAPEILGETGPDVIIDRAERILRIERGQPRDNLILSGLYQIGDFDLKLEFQRFGSYRLVNYRSDPTYDQTVTPSWITSLDLAWRPSDNLELALGAHNLFDVLPDANRGYSFDPFTGPGKIIPFAANSPFGYNGAFWYARLQYNF